MYNTGTPNDSDSQAIGRVIRSGSDLARPMKVDFHMATSDEASARLIAAAASIQAFEVAVARNQAGGAWTCSCSRNMVVSRDSVLRVQQELDVLSQPFGGHSDGWGTFGNRRNG